MNFKNILNIRNITQLKKYDLDKPIYHNNYLFHYLIIFNNLNALKLYEFPIFKENNDGYNGFFLAAKEDNINILYYLIKNYSNYIYNRNIDNELFTDYLEIDRFNDLIKKFPNLDWNKTLINDQLLWIILTNLNYNKLKEFIKIFIDKNNIITILFGIIKNNNLKTHEIIDMLDQYSDEEINFKNNNNTGLLLHSFNNIEIFNYLLQRNIDTNYYTIISTENPIRNAIRYDILNGNREFTKNLKFDKEIYNELDKYSENLAHTILNMRLSRNSQLNNLNKVDYSLDIDLLKLCDTECWNQYNINKITPIHLVSQLDYNIYSKLFTDKNISINTFILPQINNKIWLNLFNKLPQFKVNIINIDTQIDCTKFQSKFSDISIFMLYLSKKYKTLLIPKINSYLLNNLTYINSFPFSDNIINQEPIFPWIISINSETEYYIHPYLNNIINAFSKANSKSFGIVFLGLSIDNLLHANLIIYDFKNKLIERFEPYGKCVNYFIDTILEEELTWNTGFKYIKPSDYEPYAGFQTISDENNNNNLKPGDFGGFCLAWCLWYLETKLINPNIPSKILIKKLINRLNEQNISFSEYIRNYSDKINKVRIKYLEIIGIKKNKISNIYLNDNNNLKIINYLISKFS
jgi:hypothetical protein